MTTESSEAVIVERTLNAPVAKVWKALTEVDQMSEWYFDLKEFKAEVGFAFGFVVEHEGNTYDHRCKVTEVVPQKKIAYTWRYHGHEGNSLVTIELFTQGDKTRLKLTHTGLDTFPKTPAFARKNFESGWTSIIGTDLKQFVERIISKGTKQSSANTVRLHRVLRATPEKVYRAFLDPEALVKWLPPNGFTCKVHEMKAKVGGSFKMLFRNFTTGKSHSFGGTYVDLTPHERIRYTEKFDDPNMPGEMQTKITLKKVSCGTEVSIVQEGIPTVIPAEMCYLGWQESLILLAKLVEAEIPDQP